MKTASVITVHVGTNVGSNLQAIATCRILEDMGIETTLVNYIPPRVTEHRYWQVARTSPIKFLWRIINFPSFKYNQRAFNSFLNSYIKLSPPIFAEDCFKDKCPSADYYVTGSDQVWNSSWNEGVDTHYFYDKIKGTKIAFASSIGSTELSKTEVDAFKTFLPDYSAISVRERDSQILLSDLGFDVVHLLDPTLLLNNRQWCTYMRDTIKIRSPYVLVYVPYSIVNKESIFHTARILANKHGLKVVTFSWNYFSERLADKTIRGANPGEFLYLVSHASYVITNSFHGTAFSINLNKQFWVYLPSKFSSRISSLLSICNLQNRILREDGDFTELDTRIDYEPVNGILESERLKAHSFLQKAFI